MAMSPSSKGSFHNKNGKSGGGGNGMNSWKPWLFVVGTLIAHSSLYYYMAASRVLRNEAGGGGAGDSGSMSQLLDFTQPRAISSNEFKSLVNELKEASETLHHNTQKELNEMKSSQNEFHQSLRATIGSGSGSSSSSAAVDLDAKLTNILDKIEQQSKQLQQRPPASSPASSSSMVTPWTHGPNGEEYPPPIVFTQCCWCPTNETWYPGGNYDRMSIDINWFRKKKGIDANWMTMPCRQQTKGPDLNDSLQRAKWERYAMALREARDRGAIIGTALHRRVGSRNGCCLDAEVTNVWVERALADGDEAQVDKVMALQNKSSLHDAFVEAGEENRVPKLYTEQEVKDRNIEYPVFAKAMRGIFGSNVWAIHNETELEDVLRKTKKLQSQQGLIVEEALVGDRPYTIHYLSWFHPLTKEYRVSYWCGVYEKEGWKDQGIFVQGQDRNPKIKKVECHPDDLEAFTNVIKSVGMKSGLGCVNGKDTNGRGTIKIFDWNIRMCGSLEKEIIDDMFKGFGTVYDGSRFRIYHK